jgi:PAS domain S-box-containing protein
MLLGAMLTIACLFATNAVILRMGARGRMVEGKLKDTEERMKLALQGTNDGLFDYDVKNQQIYYSPRYKEMLGYWDEEFPDTLAASQERIHPEDYERAMETLRRYMQRELPSYVNIYRMRHKDGSYRWIMSRALGIWDEKGQLRRLVGAHTDITDQKRREEHLAALNKELESFTYIASHDLRAPLVNLKGFASEMQYSMDEVVKIVDEHAAAFEAKPKEALRKALKEDIPESLHYITSSVDKMDALTTAILDLSRIGRRVLKIEDIKVDKLVERCLHTLAYEITNQNIDVRVGALPEIKADYLALEQIFSNILDNAVKYLDPARPGIITIEGATHDNETIFTVKDNGRGIDVHDMQKVFDMFRRAGNSGGVRGSGMGMAYVKATVQRLGGRIWVESVPGQGTAFHFAIPRTFKEELNA